MQLKVNASPAALQESTGSSYISKSGIYDVIIKFVSVDVTRNGAEQANFNFEYNGNSQTVYGPYVTNTDGNPNEIGMKLINKLAIISGLGEGESLELSEETYNVGKDNKAKDFQVITNFSDLPVKVRLQEKYSVNPKTNEIKKEMVIKAFFREDGASAEEIVNGTEIGKRLAIETEKYASNITYDGVTPEQVAEWKEAKKSGAAPTKPAPKTANKPATGLFK